MKTTREISNSDDVIDSRDVITRIAELEQADELSEIEVDELKALRALADEADGYGDWKYGETLIRESYFQTYAQKLAEDIGAINKDASWPNNFIDWDAATDALKRDYTKVDFDGVTYLVRL